MVYWTLPPSPGPSPTENPTENPDYSRAAAPEMISMSSVVMTA